MRNIKIISTSGITPENSIEFNNNKRWRVTENTSQLDLAENASLIALNKANMTIEHIDLIIAASATYMQPLPCNAALIHERIAKGTSIPAFDINSTCTSFLSALDTISHLIHNKAYKNVLIVSSDVPSLGLNKNEKESFELFSDGASAIIITYSEDSSSFINCSAIGTWSEGVHDTEIKSGGTLKGPKFHKENNKEEYQFSMNGLKVLRLVCKKSIPFIDNFLKENHIKKEDIDLIIPHQASIALDLIMKKMGFKKEQYVNIVQDYGNMVSASIPFTLNFAIENSLVTRGDKILLVGTAAGLTTNILYFTY